MKIYAGARSSPLSRKQMSEIIEALRPHHPELLLEALWVETKGDKDKKTSLRGMGKTDFFTQELDNLLLEGKIRIAVHSAKDLPEPLPQGIAIAALTAGIDPSDSLMLREGYSLETLPSGATIATSSLRREEMVKQLRPDLRFIDLRGTIQERISLIEKGAADGVVVAEAALIRLELTHLNRVKLPGETVPGQGKLAVLAKSDDHEMKKLFSCIDTSR